MQSNNNNNNKIREENNGKESIQGSEREKLEKYSNYERISLFAISHSWFGSGHMFTVSFDCYLNLLKLHLGSWLLYRSLPVVQLPLPLPLPPVRLVLFVCILMTNIYHEIKQHVSNSFRHHFSFNGSFIRLRLTSPHFETKKKEKNCPKRACSNDMMMEFHDGCSKK